MAGFRFRIVLLLLPIIYVGFIKYKIFSKKFLLLTIVFFLLVLSLGIISHIRSYGSGLDFSLLQSQKLPFFTLIINGIFVDTSTVLVTGYFIDRFDSINFSYFNQFFYIIEYLIPSFFLVKKTYSPVLSYVHDITNTTSGAAILSIGDYYHTGGTIAVVLFAFFFSSIFTYLFKKQYLLNISFYLFSYSTYIIWLINHYTRGYLPQGFADLISLVLGLYLIKRQYLKKYLLKI
jgi:oligosaccharide repeat unit polymerase